MSKYAYFNPSLSPSPVLGWYDTDNFTYPKLPPDNSLLALSEMQWQSRLNNNYAVQDGQLIVYTPPAPIPTLAQQAGNLLAAGCQINSTSTPSLNGVYSCSASAQSFTQAEVISILLNNTFTDGTTSIAWLDMSGNPHTFTIDQFKSFASGIASFVTACQRCITGQSTSLPTEPITIP
jgi:hypothetical protein